MPNPLLSTKLYMPPAHPDMVPRPRLTSRITRGLNLPLLLISAPAGFGKTTVLSEWRSSPAGQACPLAWLSLDPADSDPLRFWTYLIAALKTLPAFAAAEKFCEATLETLQTSQALPPDRYLTALINEAAAHPGPFVLVLDDLHAVEARPIHDALFFLVEQMPPNMHLFVLTRSDPPWALARLRAHGRMAELREEDLRFTAAEVDHLLNGIRAFGLSPADLSALESRTEGWVAALQMTALSLERHPDRSGFIAALAGDNRFIADYLTEEVLAGQDEPLKRFLLSTSILERFCAPLCASVTGQPEAGAILARVERSNLFLIPLDAERRWYRYHHLFADLLNARLRHEQADQIEALHRRAAAWFEQNGFPADAVHHALAAREYDRAARMIEENAPNWWAGAASTLWTLLTRLPPEVVRRRPALCIHQAWGDVMTGRLEPAAERIRAAEERLAAPEWAEAPNAAAMGSFAALIRTYLAELTDQPCAPTELELQGPSFIPEENVAMRNSADVMLAMLLQMRGELDRAAPILKATAAREARLGSTNATPIAMSLLARIRYVQGRLSEAEQICRSSLAYTAQRGERRFFVNGNLHAVLSDLLRERGDLTAADGHAALAAEQNRDWPYPGAAATVLATLARLRFSQGRMGEAQAALEQQGQVLRSARLPTDTVGQYHAMQVRLWLARGDLGAAKTWADTAADLPLSFRREPEQIALSRVMIARGRPEEALSLLSRLAEAAAAGGRTARLIEVQILQAIALRSLHQSQRAASALASALALGEPEGFVRTFADEGEPVLDLLRSLSGLGPGTQLAARLLRSGGAAPAPAPQEGPGLIEPLSAREQEILDLLAAGLSNQAIAARLTVVVGTVKTHLHNIYGKLGAESRTQALARARALRLLR